MKDIFQENDEDRFSMIISLATLFGIKTTGVECTICLILLFAHFTIIGIMGDVSLSESAWVVEINFKTLRIWCCMKLMQKNTTTCEIYILKEDVCFGTWYVMLWRGYFTTISNWTTPICVWSYLERSVLVPLHVLNAFINIVSSIAIN